MLCGTSIRYTLLLVPLVGVDLAGGAEEGGDSSGRRFLRVVVDLVQSTSYTFGVRRFKSIEGFYDDDSSSGAQIINNVKPAPVRER
jgi:hypothetical protein